jgi:xylitol oxidase
VLKVIPQVEAKLKPFSPRPHWGKVNTLRAANIEPQYPRAGDFKDLMRHYDPRAKFVNAYILEKL